MFLGLIFPGDQIEPQVTADAMGEVDHQIAPPQVRKTVDGPTQPPPCGAADFLAVEQLPAADHDPSRLGQAKSSVQTAEQ